MAQRSTREETLNAEDEAVRLAARGLNYREIGLALGLSESEARRKRQLGLKRRRQEDAAAGDWMRVDAELAEALRTAYQDHDDAPAGSAARVGSMKVVMELITRRARLNGIEIGRAGLGPTSEGNSGDGDWTRIRQLESELEAVAREAAKRLDRDFDALAEKIFGPENVSPPQREAGSTDGGTEAW